jgi:hypothetical protein
MPFVVFSSVFILYGFLMAALGLIIWKKQKVNWVSSHAYVNQKDIAAFTKMVGECAIGIGISFFVLGFFGAINMFFVGLILFGIGFVASLFVYIAAQKKYNRVTGV